MNTAASGPWPPGIWDALSEWALLKKYAKEDWKTHLLRLDERQEQRVSHPLDERAKTIRDWERYSRTIGAAVIVNKPRTTGSSYLTMQHALERHAMEMFRSYDVPVERALKYLRHFQERGFSNEETFRLATQLCRDEMAVRTKVQPEQIAQLLASFAPKKPKLDSMNRKQRRAEMARWRRSRRR